MRAPASRLKGNHERIPHEEKVFSLFEPHTELIKKGKARPPVEFGHRVLLSTEQHGLIVDYKVMFGGSEPGEILPLVRRLMPRFGKDSIRSLSIDKGFSTEENRRALAELIEEVVMPKKGRCTPADLEREKDRRWKSLKNRHSAIESDINSLEHHGLNRCPDKGLEGYERYVGLGVLAMTCTASERPCWPRRAKAAGADDEREPPERSGLSKTRCRPGLHRV